MKELIKRGLVGLAAVVALLALGGVGTAQAADSGDSVIDWTFTKGGGQNVIDWTLLPPSPTPPPGLPSDYAPAGKHANKGQPLVSTKTRTSSTLLADDVYYTYVQGAATLANDGIYANGTIANPAIHTGALPQDGQGTHSLMELAATRSIGGKRQIVEVGWTKDPVICSSNPGYPCLFVFNWVDDQPGCYNGCGFVQYTGTGSTVAGSTLQSSVGLTKKFGIVFFNNAWWIAYDTGWVGYFPLTDWTSVNPALSTFTQADYWQAFGEVASINDSTPCSDMGSGDQGSTGVSGSTVPRWSSATFQTGTVFPSFTYSSTDPVAYSYAGPSARSFYLGGPGRNAAGTGTGTKGAC